LYKNHKAGLVDPAFFLWNWFVGLIPIGKPECQNPVGLMASSNPAVCEFSRIQL